MTIEVSPKDFTNGVLSIAKDVFGETAKYIPRTRAVKLVCVVAEEIGFEAIPRGWYKFGVYSFKVDSLIRHHFARNLLVTDLPQVNLPKELGEKIERVLKSVQGQFISQSDAFMKWIHYEVAPEPYRNFYKCHDEFLAALCAITNTSRQNAILMHPHDWIGEIITRYNLCLRHVPEDRLSLFFDFADLLEGLLLVVKRRSLEISEVSDLICQLKSLYNSKIYPCITPFEHSLKGTGKEEELQVFRNNTNQFYIDSVRELSSIKHLMEKRGLLPTLEELDQEILERLDTRKESELADLAGTFRALT